MRICMYTMYMYIVCPSTVHVHVHHTVHVCACITCIWQNIQIMHLYMHMFTFIQRYKTCYNSVPFLKNFFRVHSRNVQLCQERGISLCEYLCLAISCTCTCKSTCIYMYVVLS